MTSADTVDSSASDKHNPDVVPTEAGCVRGVTTPAGQSWWGVPYAAAPVADLRWRSARRVTPWSGIRSALTPAPIAIQHTSMRTGVLPGVITSEDCLYLNVFRPRQIREALPVLVWVHGGAFTSGSGSMYDGSYLAKTANAVVVTFNYRLGALGFLDLSRYGDFDSNIGVRDTAAALEWVHRNIAAFGGDPARVTMFGQSAGAGIVLALMTHRPIERIVHRAIVQSPPSLSVHSRSMAAEVAGRFVAGCRALYGSTDLRSLSAQQIQRVAQPLMKTVARDHPGLVAYCPVVDDVVTNYPVAVFQQGLQARIPLIIGSNRREASLFKLSPAPLMPVRVSALADVVARMRISPHNEKVPSIEQVRDSYPYRRMETGILAGGDLRYRVGSVEIARVHSAVAPAWLYRFDLVQPLPRLFDMHAAHGIEIALIFGPGDGPVSFGVRRRSRDLARRMQLMWSRFAETGCPAPASVWPPIDKYSNSSYVFDARDRVCDVDYELRRTWGQDIRSLS